MRRCETKAWCDDGLFCVACHLENVSHNYALSCDHYVENEKRKKRMYKYIFGVYSVTAPQQSTGFNLGGEEYGWGTFSFLLT